MSLLYLIGGDNHLGKGASLYEGRLAEQEQVWADFLELARSHDVQAVIHCGDLWDRRKPTPEEYLAAERPLVAHRAAGGPPVIVVAGNHDRSGVDAQLALQVLDEAGLIRLSTQPERILLDGGCWLCTLPWTPVSRLVADAGGGDRDDINLVAAELLVEAARGLLADCLARDADLPAILALHWSIASGRTPTGLEAQPHVFREPVLSLHDLEYSGFDAVVAGHLHAPQLMSIDAEPAIPVLYTGSPMPLDHAEGGCEHGCWLLDLLSGDTKATVPQFLPLASRPFVTVDFDPRVHQTTVLGDFGVPLPAPGAVIRLRVRTDASIPVDTRQLRELLDKAGAHHAVVTVDVEPAARPSRGVAIADDLTPTDALGVWLAEAGVNGDEGARLVERGRAYLEGVA